MVKKIVEKRSLYRCLRGKGAFRILKALSKAQEPLNFTDIEIEYVKREDEKLSPQTLSKRLNELREMGLIEKSDDKYIIKEPGETLVNCIDEVIEEIEENI